MLCRVSAATPPGHPTLARRLGTGDAVVVGLSSMIGAGVFVVLAPTTAAAGSGVWLALLLAAGVALCNAIASAQLARQLPASGGSYLFGRVLLGPWPGFLAGWGFVIGKTASCAAMALTAATYLLPADSGGSGPTWGQRGVAVATVALLTLGGLRGITRTAQMARVLLTLTLATLALVVVVGLVSLPASPASPDLAGDPGGPLGVLRAAALFFFAFAGYARIATLAEEVRRPERLGRAVLLALALVVGLYLAVTAVALLTLGPRLPHEAAPLAAVVRVAGATWALPVVRIGAACAALGALLALLAGISRTMLAMARERDLPVALDSVDPRHQVPDRAQVVVGAAVIVLVLVADLRGAIGFSSFGVLVYYAVANAAALRQPREHRR